MSQRWRWWMRSSSLVFLSAVLLFGEEVKRYAGSWKSDGGNASGNIQMVIGPSAAESKILFTIGSSEVETTIKRFKDEGERVTVAYEFEIEGNRLVSTITGTRQGKKLEGKYQTVAIASAQQVDSGTFSSRE